MYKTLHYRVQYRMHAMHVHQIHKTSRTWRIKNCDCPALFLLFRLLHTYNTSDALRTRVVFTSNILLFLDVHAVRYRCPPLHHHPALFSCMYAYTLARKALVPTIPKQLFGYRLHYTLPAHARKTDARQGNTKRKKT